MDRVFENHWAREAAAHTVPRPRCRCLDAMYDGGEWPELALHAEEQDYACSGYARLMELIDEAANDGRELFSPSREMAPEQWVQITTLPGSIGKLKAVKHLILYGSCLVKIPPAIGEMTNLEQFSPYTSDRLHWFPYEILRCTRLKDSTVSTRRLYGNYSYRPPFPRLPQLSEVLAPKTCSVCNGAFGDSGPIQFWISLRVATDVLPLLGHACSKECVSKTPPPAEGYVQFPHQGGFGLNQPPIW